MADSLADLFVSFKAVERPQNKSYLDNFFNIHNGSFSGRNINYILNDIDNEFAGNASSVYRNNSSYSNYPFDYNYSYTPYYFPGTRYTSSRTTWNPAISDLTENIYVDQYTGEDYVPRDKQKITNYYVRQALNKLGLREGIDYSLQGNLRIGDPLNPAIGVSNSKHYSGEAADISLLDEDGHEIADPEVYAQFMNLLANNNEACEILDLAGLGALKEATNEELESYNATAPNIHFGTDSKIQNWRSKYVSSENRGGIISAKKGTDLAENKTDNKNDAENKDKNLTIDEWTLKMYATYQTVLREKYGKDYDDSDLDKIALYMTAQTALSSNFGSTDDYNYGELRTENGDRAKFKSIKDFAEAQVKTLDAWGVVDARSLREYVGKLYNNDKGMVYDASEYPDEMYSDMEDVASQINDDLGLKMRVGGKFEKLRDASAKFTKLMSNFESKK